MKTAVCVFSHYLEGSVPGDPSRCPIKRAIEDQTGLVATVLGPVAFLEMRDGTRRCVTMPAVVDRFITEHDGGVLSPGSTPFAFWLDTEDIALGWDYAPAIGQFACSCEGNIECSCGGSACRGWCGTKVTR